MSQKENETKTQHDRFYMIMVVLAFILTVAMSQVVNA